MDAGNSDLQNMYYYYPLKSIVCVYGVFLESVFHRLQKYAPCGRPKQAKRTNAGRKADALCNTFINYIGQKS